MRTHCLAVLVGLWWVAAAIVLCTLLSLSGCWEGCSGTIESCAKGCVLSGSRMVTFGDGRGCICEPSRVDGGAK